MSRIVEGQGGQPLVLDDKSQEPLLVPMLTAALTHGVAVLVAFNVELTGAQQAAVIGLPAVVVPLGAWLWARRRAWSGRTVAEVLDRQLDQVTRPQT